MSAQLRCLTTGRTLHSPEKPKRRHRVRERALSPRLQAEGGLVRGISNGREPHSRSALGSPLTTASARPAPPTPPSSSAPRWRCAPDTACAHTLSQALPAPRFRVPAPPPQVSPVLHPCFPLRGPGSTRKTPPAFGYTCRSPLCESCFHPRTPDVPHPGTTAGFAARSPARPPVCTAKPPLLRASA